uniref:Uncharacterized protein n=1 Tax=Siphoviridae sp. ctAUQ2 TaxID=2826182 RepID=A0A8S5MZ03_9CAUD|nr:MAG TPA: hypothetical protein [Siphoviridae sp. ctAUQ2]
MRRQTEGATLPAQHSIQYLPSLPPSLLTPIVLTASHSASHLSTILSHVHVSQPSHNHSL